MPETLVEQLIRHEGLRLFPYQDGVGKWTIGVGRNLTDCGISKAEALAMLERDLSDAAMDLMQFAWFPRLDLARQNAFINMRFNLGPAGFRKFKAMLLALERGQFSVAAEEMRDSKWYRQVGARAEELAETVDTGVA